MSDTGESTSSARAVGEYLDEAAFGPFVRSLAMVRSVGLAFNREEAERGVSAVACAVRDPEGRPLGALSVSVPSQRGAVIKDPRVIRALREVAGEVEAEIARAVAPESWDHHFWCAVFTEGPGRACSTAIRNSHHIGG